MSRLAKKIIIVFLIASFSLAQFFVIPLVPKAQAQEEAAAVLSVPTTVVADIPATKQRILVAIAEGIALGIAQRFTRQFIDRLVAKYKIGNYLYYDQVLTNYYLSNYIFDKVSDPDLQNIFMLLQAGYVTGDFTGTVGQPNRDQALIPRLKKKISDLYIKQGGIDPNFIQNPPSNISGLDYYTGAYNYYSNPLSYTESNLIGQYGALQSSATTASQLEVIVGNGLKAGRIIGGQCMMPTGVEEDLSDPAACTSKNGTWQTSALDQARSFITNPTAYIQSWMDGVIKTWVDTAFNPNNYWTKIGSALGSFLYNQLALNKNKGVLNEGQSYSPGTYTPESSTANGGIDLDKDGVADGIDYDSNGVIDICVYGGTPPDQCVGSLTAANPPPPTSDGGITCEMAPTSLSCLAPNHADLVARVIAYLTAQNISMSGNCGAFEIVKRVAWALRNEGGGLLTTFHSTQCNGYSADVIAYTDNSQVDILGDAGGANSPQWNPMGPSTESGVSYAPPIDPGDPAGSY